MMKVVVLVLAILAVALAAPKVDTQADWRVVGGNTAAAGQFPYIVSLRTLLDSHTCGGSLIRSDLVITAAHCVTAISALWYTVVAGINELNNAANGVRSSIASIAAHENYNGNTIVNDIALLRLSTPIQESTRIAIIPLETQNIDTVRDVVLSGWGRTSYPGNIPNSLQFLNTRTTTIATCRNAWPGSTITDGQICIFSQVGQGACHGDSGGPLADYSSGSAVLVGIVSWGNPCAVGSPDVFTRVSSYISWINQNS